MTQQVSGQFSCSAHPLFVFRKQNTLEYITMAALSKLFAVATTYPYQVVRVRLQDQHNKYNGVVDVMSRTWRYDAELLTAWLNVLSLILRSKVHKVQLSSFSLT